MLKPRSNKSHLYINEDSKRSALWSIVPMKRADIPDIVTWVIALDPARGQEEELIRKQFQNAFNLAREKRSSDDWVGKRNKNNIASINGWLPGMKDDTPIHRADNRNYKIKILLNPHLQAGEQLYVYRLFVSFVFTDRNVARVLMDLDDSDIEQILVIELLGFRKLKPIELFIPGRSWYACLREDFTSISIAGFNS